MIQGIDVALSQLGIAEATGKNDGIPAERYMRGDKLAWCAGFVLWCNANSDDENLATSTKEHYAMRSVTSMIEHCKRKGIFLSSQDTTPQRNDIVFFGDTDSDVGVKGSHVGIVESFDPTTRKLTSIEGNYGNKVARVTQVIGKRKITGFARPDLLEKR